MLSFHNLFGMPTDDSGEPTSLGRFVTRLFAGRSDTKRSRQKVLTGSTEPKRRTKIIGASPEVCCQDC